MFGRSTSTFDRLLEKATSQLLLEPDWTSIMMICDSIRQGDTNPKYAVTAIKKKFYHQNPHSAHYALQVMESCVKNCGVLIHDEIATKAFMEEMRALVKQTTEENIKSKVLELIQIWGTAFRNSPKYRIVTDTLHLMQAEGWKFPPVREAEAMFEADTAPEWAEGEVCNRCRVQFTTFTRQHHCRACGQVFCSKCSGKSCVLPKFGIEREVRVCDSCFDKYGPKDDLSPTQKPKPLVPAAPTTSDLPVEYLSSPLSKQPQEPPKTGKTDAELKEEEELQLVLALSKSEAEEQEKQKKKATSEILAGFGQEKSKHKDTNGVSGKSGSGLTGLSEEGQDPELAKYLNRDYWQQRNSETGTSGSISGGVQQAKQASLNTKEEKYQGSDTMVAALSDNRTDEEELDEFTSNLRTQIEIFVNRMKSNSSRGRPIANDTSVQTLFMNVMAMHSRLVKFIQEQEDDRVRYEGLQDKLNQVKDARAALDALREEERERKRREAEEAERLRQIQLAQKLEVMRKKKAEYLEYQRQVALQRMAEQEQEMAKIHQANKQAYLQQQQGLYSMYLPYGYGAMQPGMAPPGQQPYMPPGQPMYPHHGMPQQPMGVPTTAVPTTSMMPPQQQPPVNAEAGGGPQQQPPPQQQVGGPQQMQPPTGENPGGAMVPNPPTAVPMMGGANGGAPGQMMPAGGYQPAPNYYPPPSNGNGPQQPPAPHQGMLTSAPAPPSYESVAYNMGGMASALPTVQQTAPPPADEGAQQQQPIEQQQNTASLIFFD